MKRLGLAFLGVVVAIGLGWLGSQLWDGRQAPREAAGSGGEEEAAFLERFWSNPIPAQGKPPADFTPLEASLGPQSCRSCHPDKFKQWDASLHSRTMGAGIWWQFLVKTPEQVKSCMRCHAPLAEQKALVAAELGWQSAPQSPPPDYIPADLHREGLVCAACHVRSHQRFGPPKAGPLPRDRAPHNGFTARTVFKESRFCAECHQFEPDGPSLHGKLRENTYAEWRKSRYADRGVTCQDCHMPQGKHTWRGIHDRAMVRQGLSVDLSGEPLGEAGFRIAGEVVNSGAGHKLPTYLTPKVFVRLLLIDPQGRVQRQLDRAVIGWKADVEMTREIFDTRLDPGEGVTLSAKVERPQQPGWEAALWVDVAPQRHYERLFRYMFKQKDKMDTETIETLEQALIWAQSTRFRARQVSWPIPGPDTSLQN